MVEPFQVVGKMYREFEGDENVLTNIWLVKHYVVCLNCGEVTGPPGAPDIEGTWFGVVALARLVGLYLSRGVDRETAAALLEQLFGFETSANSLWNGRRAVARELGPFMELLEELLLASGYVHTDETRQPRADCGGKGHAWAAACQWAAMIIFHRSRSGDIFDGALRFLRETVAVVDGYAVYRSVFREIQRCWRHIINNLKAAAARATGPGAANIIVQYGRLCGLYERIKDKDTAAESERKAILREARAIAMALPKGHPSRTEILNAGDALVTFLKYKDMPPTNNPGESVIRRGPVRHRNVRYLIRSQEGANVPGILLSFHVTCMLQRLNPIETLIKILRGGDLRCIFKAAPQGDSGGPDRPRRIMRDAVSHPRAGGGGGVRRKKGGELPRRGPARPNYDDDVRTASASTTTCRRTQWPARPGRQAHSEREECRAAAPQGRLRELAVRSCQPKADGGPRRPSGPTLRRGREQPRVRCVRADVHPVLAAAERDAAGPPAVLDGKPERLDKARPGRRAGGRVQIPKDRRPEHANGHDGMP